MRIEIIAKNYELKDRLRDVIDAKLEKFARYFEDDAIAKVVLREVGKNKYAMEITINFSGGKIMRAEVVTDNMYDNIDILLPKLERQVRKHKTRLGKRVKESAFDIDLIPHEEEPLEVARVKNPQLRKMSIKDAIVEMELTDHTFYVFINEETGIINVVYKREVGGVGLLDLVY